MYEMRNLCSVHTDTASAVKCSAQTQPEKSLKYPTRLLILPLVSMFQQVWLNLLPGALTNLDWSLQGELSHVGCGEFICVRIDEAVSLEASSQGWMLASLGGSFLFLQSPYRLHIKALI